LCVMTLSTKIALDIEDRCSLIAEHAVDATLAAAMLAPTPRFVKGFGA
jgi:hypothetical protein